MKKHAIRCLLLFIVFFAGINSVQAEPIYISVAASMGDACKQIISDFNKTSPDTVIHANSASSGALAKQIVQGAPADLYISANPRWMTYLVEKQRIAPRTIGPLAHNTLVFIARTPVSITSLSELKTLRRIAIGSPQSVPAGQYAMQAMNAVHVYRDLLKGNKLVMAKDVRQALLYADRGEVDGAMVYKTDALMAQNAKILFTVPENLHDRITYPMALTVEGAKKKEALVFYAFLKSRRAKEILEKFGFEIDK